MAERAVRELHLPEFGAIENVFLDAGGVILDETETERAKCRLIVQVLSAYVHDFGESDYWSDVKSAVALYVPNVYAYILWRHTGSETNYRAATRDFRAALDRSNPPLALMPEIGSVVRELAGEYRIGILGQYGADLLELLDRDRILRYFSFRETQEKFELTKPDPRYFEAVLRAAAARPASSVMVGDRIDKDVIPAKLIGMRTIRHRVGIHSEQVPRTFEEYPDAEIGTLSELPRLLRRARREGFSG